MNKYHKFPTGGALPKPYRHYAESHRKGGGLDGICRRTYRRRRSAAVRRSKCTVEYNHCRRPWRRAQNAFSGAENCTRLSRDIGGLCKSRNWRHGRHGRADAGRSKYLHCNSNNNLKWIYALAKPNQLGDIARAGILHGYHVAPREAVSL